MVKNEMMFVTHITTPPCKGKAYLRELDKRVFDQQL